MSVPYRLVLLVLFALLSSLGMAFAFYTAHADSPRVGTSNAIQATSIEQNAPLIKEGDAASSKFIINRDYVDPDNNCEFCTVMIYNPGIKHDAGVAYKDAKINFGDAKRLVFFAKGQTGQNVSFAAVGNDTTVTGENDTDVFPKIDFSVVTKNVTLSNDWQRFEISLNNSNVTDANYPFGIQMSPSKNKGPMIFYLKGVTLDSKPAQNPLPTINGTQLVNETDLGVTIISNSTNNNSTAPTTVEFKANATGGVAPYSFNWNFADSKNGSSGVNSTGIGEIVSHTFSQPGLYNITLAAKDSSTPTQNASANVLITIRSAANTTNSSGTESSKILSEPLTARIDSNSTNNNSTAPTTVEFKANATGGVAPYSFNWNFADSKNGSSGVNSTGIGEIVSHTFSQPGLYNITLAAKDSSTPTQNASANVLITIRSAVNNTELSIPGVDINRTIINGTVGNSTILEPTNNTSTTSENITSTNSTGIDANSTNTSTGANSTNTSTGANSTNTSSDANSTNTSTASSPISSINGTNNVGISFTNSGTTGNYPIPDIGENKANRTVEAGPEGSISQNVTSSSRTDSLNDEISTIKQQARNNNGTDRSSQLEPAKPDQFPNLLTQGQANHSPVAYDLQVLVNSNIPNEIQLKGSDPDNDPITFEIVSKPLHGTLAGIDKEKGIVSYVAEPGAVGSDFLRFKVTDNHDSSSRVGRVSITIQRPEYTQVSVADVHAATISNGAVNIDLKSSGADNEKFVKFIIVSDPSHGKLSKPSRVDQTSGIVTYTPEKGFVGNDHFRFKAVNSMDVNSNIGNVSLVVIAGPANSNSPPVADSQTVTGEENKKIQIALRGEDEDKEKFTFSLLSRPSHGKISSFDSSDGSLIYKPDPNFNGDDIFTFQVVDSNGATSNSGKVSIKINSLDTPSANLLLGRQEKTGRLVDSNLTSSIPGNLNNRQPSANGGPDVTVYEDTTGVTLDGSGKDRDGDKLSYSWRQINGPRVELAETNNQNLKFNSPTVSTDTLLQFSLTVSDDKGGHDTDVVNVLVKNREVNQLNLQTESLPTKNNGAPYLNENNNSTRTLNALSDNSG